MPLWGVDVHPARLAPVNDPDPKVSAARDALQTALKNNAFDPTKLDATAKAAYGGTKAQDHLIVVMVPAYFSGAESDDVGVTIVEHNAQNIRGNNSWCFVSLPMLKRGQQRIETSAHEIGHALGLTHLIPPECKKRPPWNLMADGITANGILHKPDLDSKRFLWDDIQRFLITPAEFTSKYLIRVP